MEEVDGDPYRYFLLAGTTRPYPDDTFYSVGRVPRKLLMKYLGVKMYLVTISAVKRSIGSTTGCTITEKASTRAFSWLKAPTSAFTFKTLW